MSRGGGGLKDRAGGMTRDDVGDGQGAPGNDPRDGAAIPILAAQEGYEEAREAERDRIDAEVVAEIEKLPLPIALTGYSRKIRRCVS